MNEQILTEVNGFIPFLQSIASALIVFIFIYISKLVMDTMVNKDYNPNYEIEEKNNLAIAMRRNGLYLGIGIAMYGTISNFTEQFLNGTLILIFMLIVYYISEYITIPKYNNQQALKENNVAVGLTEAGLFISTGIIAHGSLTGAGPWYSSIVFFILGQIVLIAMVKVFEQLHKDLLQNIKDSNTSAGLLLGGSMIAYSLILQSSVSGDFIGWSEDLIAFSTSIISGFILILLFANKAIDKLFLPGTNIKQEIQDKNIAAISIVIIMKIVIALIISAVML